MRIAAYGIQDCVLFVAVLQLVCAYACMLHMTYSLQVLSRYLATSKLLLSQLSHFLTTICNIYISKKNDFCLYINYYIHKQNQKIFENQKIKRLSKNEIIEIINVFEIIR